LRLNNLVGLAAAWALLFGACSGDSDPEPAGQIEQRTVRAQQTDPAISQGIGDHLVTAPPEERRAGKLWLFLPGTGARPDQYTFIATRAAELGYHSIHLSYINDKAVNRVCPGQGPTCHEDMRREIITGEPTSEFVDVDAANSIVSRLTSLVLFLDREFPGEGWATFLRSGQLRWDLITVAGHSQGGGHAAFIAKLYSVERAVLFSATEPAPWTTMPGATPPERYFGFAHELEQLYAGITRSWETLAIPSLVTNVDEGDPPFAGANRLSTAREVCRGDTTSIGYYHNCHIVDAFTPLLDDGQTPAYQPVWDYLIAGGAR
jgi:hypothetical protein